MDPTTVLDAVSALLTLHEKQSTSSGHKRKLFGSDEDVFLVIAKRAPDNKWSPAPSQFHLPHPIHTNSSICLVVKDPLIDWKERVKDKNYPVEKVIGLKKLKTNYIRFESKRKLCQSYDLFLVDERVFPRSVYCFGTEFFSRNKYPIPVKLTEPDDIEKNRNVINTAVHSTYSHANKGVTKSIKVGKTNFTKEQLVENVKEVIDQLTKKKKSSWPHIKSLYIRTNNGTALPLYYSMRKKKMIDSNRE
jgi:ribosome biogenesis protein UTP30